ncbi:MAG TPA: acyl-CoA dehydrogenase family protein, partial [Candidatus Limnocylindria bacterium]|nr:acyl-CoA dehydrogenase family protein [Candidatus Limnocylindria bacterium]
MATTTSTEAAAGFDLTLSPEQEMVQHTAREFAREKVLPLAHEIDEHKAVPPEILAEMGRLGFMGIDVPERYGGAGLDALTYVLVVEEINRACASTGVILCSHVSLAIEPILRWGTDAQKERWLPAMARGESLGCFALSEPAAGSDAAAMRTSARQDGDHWVLNGTKNFITNGSKAGVAIVFAQTDPAQRHKGIAAFVVERGTPGFSVGKLESKLGIRGSDTAQLVFEDCRVPAANLLGKVGEGFKIALSTLDGGRISIAAQAVGIARACLEDALAYAKERQAFGKPI